jgi:hypothetical protein
MRSGRPTFKLVDVGVSEFHQDAAAALEVDVAKLERRARRVREEVARVREHAGGHVGEAGRLLRALGAALRVDADAVLGNCTVVQRAQRPASKRAARAWSRHAAVSAVLLSISARMPHSRSSWPVNDRYLR